MSFFATKTLLAVLFIAAGLTAALSMLTLMGKSERKMGVMALRNTHRAAGYTFVVLLVVLAIMGLSYLSAAADTLSLRGVLHWSTAALLVFVLALKLAVVRWFKQFIKFVPVMGMIVITLALVVATLSAVFFIVTGGLAGPGSAEVAEVAAEAGAEAREQGGDDVRATDTAGGTGGASAGEQVFAENCSGCHNSGSTERKIGPGLAGLFGRETIEASGRAVSPANVRAQIVTPAGGMPSFKGFLSEEQLDDLIAYLQTL